MVETPPPSPTDMPAKGMIDTSAPVAPREGMAAPKGEILSELKPTSEKEPKLGFSEKAFNFFNMYILGFVVNTAMSLYITYNVKLSPQGQRAQAGMNNFFTPVAKGWANLTGKDINNPEAQKNIAKMAESTTEISFMMISGVIITGVMYGMDLARHKIIGAMESVGHAISGKPKLSEEERKAREEELKSRRTPGKTWIKSRVISMGAVLATNWALDQWNKNHKFKAEDPAHGKWNSDEMAWNLGGKVFDKMAENETGVFSAKTRDKISDFFNEHKDQLKPPKDLIGRELNGRRGVFREQFRLVLKDVSFTLFLAGMMDGLQALFGKNDKKKEKLEERKAATATSKELAASALAANPETPAEGADLENAAQKKFTDTVIKRDAAKIEPRPVIERHDSFSRDGVAAGIEKARAETALAHTIH